ncbi:hypothetical protein [Halorubrum sp. SY-15]|uniref:hypothetical protein n=1 Tax=Halorubrum sp. SY-15 TaxID=3402277 RepID=UPI003EBBC87F
MVSRENVIVACCVSAGLLLGYAGRVATDLRDPMLIGVVIFVGVVLPQVLTEWRDGTDSA